MDIITVINAMLRAYDMRHGFDMRHPPYNRRNRQFHKFRDWIIKRDTRFGNAIATKTIEADYWKQAYKEAATHEIELEMELEQQP